MAVTLKFLSRAPCAQQMLSSSPKILGATPKSFLGSPKTPFTPARSPCTSPFFMGASSPVFGDLEAARKTTADASCQLVRLALPSASMARQHCLAKQALRGSLGRSSEGEGGASLPALLGSRRPKQTTLPEMTLSERTTTAERGERRLRFADATLEHGAEVMLPVVLGRSFPPVARAIVADPAPDDSTSAAELARQSYLRKRAQAAERARGLTFP
mmetsp:Transcript_117163/g.373188  ORF Transcript_117163/g.373188 Transcript_117163/m.373188 type:complete len:215 (-) Transcript_117163:622-1266(-)|eukprot:CAMPEP_0203862546 /NCGR_PEP_ID=MMETSP0359-20131031/13647_1 /ASSEMBLY_ACC=CAM_ASM_000338 /TAXON_ID=268821 /ORGANISM="Scrippsiella Hangoei, Strain SHTV-5" /LENGTH=214 /DNA_ID=CAMNT_0050779947 /DNA_START=124 /DNA_END=768 /DNA_ORIENTATION=+